MDNFQFDDTNATLIGDADFTGTGSVQLTTTEGTFQTGAVATNLRYDLANDYSFSIGAYFGDNNAGADGISFYMHNDPGGSTQLGQSGAGLGYIGLQNGIAIEFDTWQNSGELANDHSHLRLTNTDTALTSPVDLGDIEDDTEHTIIVNWVAATRTLSWGFDGANLGSYTFTEAEMINVFGADQRVYFGMVASTGAAQNNQIVSLDVTRTVTEKNRW